VIISRRNAYHGSTMAGASLGGMAPMHEQGGLPIPGIEHIRQPYWYGEGGELCRRRSSACVAARALEEKILELGPERVGAFIGEPVQGAGGVIIPPASYWPEIQRIVDRYDVLLIADEVICGFGRTGRWFGSDYYGIRPDLMPIAKGLSSGYLPIGGSDDRRPRSPTR
jgi:putrescine---pyruvate transaminase